ncbi:MAG: hypothetical protein V4496_01950 [Pseudomonadota bacterium]
MLTSKFTQYLSMLTMIGSMVACGQAFAVENTCDKNKAEFRKLELAITSLNTKIDDLVSSTGVGDLDFTVAVRNSQGGYNRIFTTLSGTESEGTAFSPAVVKILEKDGVFEGENVAISEHTTCAFLRETMFRNGDYVIAAGKGCK